jgi:hypothetical protein
VNRIWSGASYVELTAAGDGLRHRVNEYAYEEGLTTGAGHYKTLCGRTVMAAAMITVPGPACRACRQRDDEEQCLRPVDDVGGVVPSV